MCVCVCMCVCMYKEILWYKFNTFRTCNLFNLRCMIESKLLYKSTNKWY